MFGRRPLVALTALRLFALSSGSAAAATQTVDTPAGTYYVTADASVGDPGVNITWWDVVCIEDFNQCYGPPVPSVDGVSAGVAVYEETNDCEGLQTESTDCDGDGNQDSADEPVLVYDVRF